MSLWKVTRASNYGFPSLVLQTSDGETPKGKNQPQSGDATTPDVGKQRVYGKQGQHAFSNFYTDVNPFKLYFVPCRTWRIQRLKRQRFWRVWSTFWRRWRALSALSCRPRTCPARRPMMKAGGPACWGSATSLAARAGTWWTLQRRDRPRLRRHFRSPKSTADTSVERRCTLLSVTLRCLLNIGSSSTPMHTRTSQPPILRSCSHHSWASPLLCGDPGRSDEPSLLVNADAL